MNTNKRIEELNTNLVLQETKLFLILDELKIFALKTDLAANTKFTNLIKDLEHYKNEYNCIDTQLNTFITYQTRK